MCITLNIEIGIDTIRWSTYLLFGLCQLLPSNATVA